MCRALALLFLVVVSPAAADERLRPDWSEVKCARYTAAWHEAIRRLGKAGLSDDFLAKHEAFLASGCSTEANVCPRSEEELRLANIMVIRAMNAGAASTFPPFSCRTK